MDMPREYTRTGDAFTERVRDGRGPRTVAMLHNKWTGRVFARRLSVRECPALHIREVLETFRKAGAELGTADALERLGVSLYWQPWERVATLSVEGQDVPPGSPRGGTRIALEYAPRGKARADGTRARMVLFRCPHCGGAVRAVYASRWGADGSAAVWLGEWTRTPGRPVEAVTGGGLFGCVRCLGLAYPSSQEHATPSGDGRLLGMGEPERWQHTRQGNAQERAASRLRRRCGAGLGGI